MKKRRITPTMAIQVKLALASFRKDYDRLESLKLEAQKLSLTGAEIDAAERGASFDAVIDAAVKFAVAEHARDGAALEQATKKMEALGLTMLATELRAFVAA